ncbi:MAG: hypothetical protein ACR2KK_07750 [Acidimicrobiales bacterium]
MLRAPVTPVDPLDVHVELEESSLGGGYDVWEIMVVGGVVDLRVCA